MIFSFKIPPASYTAEVSESAGLGTSVITIKAADKDLNENAKIKYSMYSGTITTTVFVLFIFYTFVSNIQIFKYSPVKIIEMEFYSRSYLNPF